MRYQKGITLVSLVIYIVVMIIVLSVMSSVINAFYDNSDTMNATVDEIIEYNKFNTYFLKEVKLYNNEVDEIGSEAGAQYITFKSGNVFLYNSNSIYYNNIKICDNVNSINFEYDTSTGENKKDIIKVTLSFSNFSKTIKYKIENIY